MILYLGTYTRQLSVIQLFNTEGVVISFGIANNPLHRLFLCSTLFGNVEQEERLKSQDKSISKLLETVSLLKKEIDELKKK